MNRAPSAQVADSSRDRMLRTMRVWMLAMVFVSSVAGRFGLAGRIMPGAAALPSSQDRMRHHRS
jgi:hypothetical protein